MADKPKVMVVDDESNNLDLIYRTLRRQFTVFRCETVTDAMTILDAEGEMAVVISDQSMPEITGVDFLIKIKQLFPRTIRILLTGYTEEQLDSQGQGIAQADIFKCITKPFVPDELKVIIDDAVSLFENSLST